MCFSSTLVASDFSGTGMNYRNGLLEWTTGMDYWNGLLELEWTTGMDYWWNRLLEWTSSLDPRPRPLRVRYSIFRSVDGLVSSSLCWISLFTHLLASMKVSCLDHCRSFFAWGGGGGGSFAGVQLLKHHFRDCVPTPMM